MIPQIYFPVHSDIPPERKPEQGYIRMFPRNENRNEGTFAKTTLLGNLPFDRWTGSWYSLAHTVSRRKIPLRKFRFSSANANTGPACISAKLIPREFFPACIGCVPGGNAWMPWRPDMSRFEFSRHVFPRLLVQASARFTDVCQDFVVIAKRQMSSRNLEH